MMCGLVGHKARELHAVPTGPTNAFLRQLLVHQSLTLAFFGRHDPRLEGGDADLALSRPEAAAQDGQFGLSPFVADLVERVPRDYRILQGCSTRRTAN